jgi:hypothetical protein
MVGILDGTAIMHVLLRPKMQATFNYENLLNLSRLEMDDMLTVKLEKCLGQGRRNDKKARGANAHQREPL